MRLRTITPSFRCTFCLLRQLQEGCERATPDISRRYRALSEGIRYLGRLQSDRFDIRIGGDVSEIVKTMTGNRDPYRKIKLDSNRMAEEWFSRRKTANVTFEYAVRLAAAANNIDYGALRTTQQPKALFERGLSGRIPTGDISRLRHLTEKSKQVLYICDNAGEIVFDKLLVSAIEKIGPEVTVAVRGGPVLNDATLEDARATGICQVAKTISTGSNLSGIVLEECSKEFVDTFRTSDLIISKGQANFETLLNISGKPATVYILKVKCDLIARHLGSRVGSTRIILDAAG